MQTRQTIRAFIESRALLKHETAAFSDADNIFELKIVSSLFAMQLVSHIEKTFDLAFEDEDLDVANFSTIDAIVRLIEAKRGPSAAAAAS